jgi:hypothetical protein
MIQALLRPQAYREDGTTSGIHPKLVTLRTDGTGLSCRHGADDVGDDAHDAEYSGIRQNAGMGSELVMDKRRLLGFPGILSVILLVFLAACGGSSEKALVVGDLAPDFTLPAADTRSVSLGDFRGKQPVFLYFHMAYG